MSGNISSTLQYFFFVKVTLLLYRLLLIMNKLEIITKVKNPPGDFLFLVSFYREMFLALPRSCNCCQILDWESSLFFFFIILVPQTSAFWK